MVYLWGKFIRNHKPGCLTQARAVTTRHFTQDRSFLAKRARHQRGGTYRLPCRLNQTRGEQQSYSVDYLHDSRYFSSVFEFYTSEPWNAATWNEKIWVVPCSSGRRPAKLCAHALIAGDKYSKHLSQASFLTSARTEVSSVIHPSTRNLTQLPAERSSSVFSIEPDMKISF